MIKRSLVDSRRPGRVLLEGAFVQLTVLVSTAADALKNTRELAVGQANAALAVLSPPLQRAQEVLGAVEEAGSAAEQIKGVVDTWTPLLKHIEKFVQLTDTISNVRPVLITSQIGTADRTCTDSSLR